MITAAFAVGRLIMDLPAGRIADRFAPMTALAVTGIGIALAAALLASARSLAQALVATAMLGLVSSQTNMTAMKLFATRGGAAGRGRSMAGYSSALMTGQTLGPAVGGILGGLIGWRAAQFGGAAVGVAVAVACWVAARRMLALAAARAAAAQAHEAGGEEARTDVPARPALGLSRRDAAVLAGVPFAVFFGMGGLLQTLVPLIAADELGLGVTVIGLALGLGGMSRALGAHVTGRVCDGVSRKAALVPGLVVMAAGALLLAPRPTLATWIVAVTLITLGSSGIHVAATMIADRVPAGTLGRHLGSYRFAGDLGLLAGPAMGGLLAEHAGRAPAMGLAAGVILSAAAAVALLVREVPLHERS
jgi:MFS family permease